MSAWRSSLCGGARRSIRQLLPALSRLRPFTQNESRLQCRVGYIVTLGGGEEVSVDLGREWDAVLAMCSHPLVRAVPWHRDSLESGCWRPLPRLQLLLVHAREELGHGHEGLDGDRREHMPDALWLWVVIHAGHLRAKLRPCQNARQYVQHDGQARTFWSSQR